MGAALAEQNTKHQAEELLETLFADGLGALFEDRDVCTYIKEGLKEVGCKPPLHVIMFALIKRGCLVGWDFAGEALRSRLVGWIAKDERRMQWLQGVANVCRDCADKNQLSSLMLAHLRGDMEGPPPEIDMATDEGVLRQLYAKRRFDDLQDDLADLANAFQDHLATLSSDAIDQQLGWAEGGTATMADSIRYNSGLYAFCGREEEIDLLDRFCGEPSMAVPSNRFSWLLLTGPGGLGKTRLAHEYTTRINGRTWRAGRLSLADLKEFQFGGWLPAKPTMIVIDYPAQDPDRVHALLANLSRRHREFDWPVRVLLLERDTSGSWFETVVPPTGDGSAIRDRVFWLDGEALVEGRKVPPLNEDALLELMVSRFGTAGVPAPDRDLLLSAARKVDSRRDRAKLPPRPLFAAAVAEVMVAELQQATTIDSAWVAVLNIQGLFDAILKRDRTQRWAPAAGGDAALIELHENLVALATLAGGLERKALEALAPKVRALVPGVELKDPYRLSETLVGCMSDYCDGAIAPLEPDLLGEYFLLRRLAAIEHQHGAETRRAFCGAALALADPRGGQPALRTLTDFPDRAEQFEWLLPEEPSASSARLLTALDTAFAASGDDGRRAQLESRTEADGFASAVVQAGVGPITYWLRSKQVRNRVVVELEEAIADESFPLIDTPITQLSGLLEAIRPIRPKLRSLRNAIWEEVARRNGANPSYLDTVGKTVKSGLIRMAQEDDRSDVVGLLDKDLRTFADRTDHSGADDLNVLLHLNGIGGLERKAAKAIVRMITTDTFPLSGISFQQILDSKARLEKFKFAAAEVKLNEMVDSLTDVETLLTLNFDAGQLQSAFSKFSGCPNFIGRLAGVFDQRIEVLFERRVSVIGQWAPLVSLASARIPNGKQRTDTLIEKFRDEIAAEIRSDTMIEVARMARSGSRHLRQLIAETLEQQGWGAREKTLPSGAMTWAPGLAFMLAKSGAIDFSGKLATFLAERAQPNDLSSPPWERRSNDASMAGSFAQAWEVIASCPNEDLAREYLDRMTPTIKRSLGFGEASSLADAISVIWIADRDRLDWGTWKAPLIARINQYLWGPQKTHPDKKIVIRLLGAAAELIGVRAFAGNFRRFVARVATPKLLASAILPHPPGSRRVQRHQLQYWIGLRYLDVHGDGHLSIDAGLLAETLALWRVNQATDDNPYYVGLNSTMVAWLEAKIGQTAPVDKT